MINGIACFAYFNKIWGIPFFTRAFNSIHLLAVLIRHEGYDLVTAGSRITDAARHYFTNFELAHIAPPPLCYP